MSTTTVNIAFQESLLREIDEVAKQESRSRSEFLREAARAYITRKRRWSELFQTGQALVRSKGLTPEDVGKEIAAYRKSKAVRS